MYHTISIHRSVVGRNYSFIHFVSIVAIPTFYWVSVVELGCFFAQNDEEFSLSFGQVSFDQLRFNYHDAQL